MTGVELTAQSANIVPLLYSRLIDENTIKILAKFFEDRKKKSNDEEEGNLDMLI